MSQWPIVTLGDVAEAYPGTRNPSIHPNAHFFYVDISSVDNKQKAIVEPKQLIGADAPSRARKIIKENDVIVSTTRPNLNAVALVGAGLDDQICSTGFCVLRAKREILAEYLFFFVTSSRFVETLSRGVGGALYPAVTDGQVRAVRIPLPPLDEQHRIVDILKRADSIRRLRKQALESTRELIPALFVDMFGDPATNPKGWGTQSLCEVSDIGSGVTKGRKLDAQETVELPYLSVANVQDSYLNLINVKTIHVKPAEIDRLSLQAGDLLMTEGGDPDKLGRCALWGGEITPCLHQNHVFRVRCNRAIVLPEYVRALAGSGYGKRYFLQVAKQTTGIASINKTQLSAFPVLVPPLDRQQEFERKCFDVRALIAQQENHLSQAEATQRALMAQYFG